MVICTHMLIILHHAPLARSLLFAWLAARTQAYIFGPSNSIPYICTNKKKEGKK